MIHCMFSPRSAQILQLTEAEPVINWWVNLMNLTNVFIWAVEKKIYQLKRPKEANYKIWRSISEKLIQWKQLSTRKSGSGRRTCAHVRMLTGSLAHTRAPPVHSQLLSDASLRLSDSHSPHLREHLFNQQSLLVTSDNQASLSSQAVGW